MQTTELKSNRKIHPFFKWLLISIFSIVTVIGLFVFYVAYMMGDNLNLGRSLSLIAVSPGPVVANLGGVQVSIPQHFAHFVEYDGDPHFMEKRTGPKPERTKDSKINSFGFEIRYPDMAGLTGDAETKASRKNDDLHLEKKVWMTVGVDSGSRYIGEGKAINNLFRNTIFRKSILPNYLEQGNSYGLSVYAVNMTDEMKIKNYNFDKNIYIHKDENNVADAFIECSNGSYKAVSCELQFELTPTMKSLVSVRFRRELLPEWRQIKSNLSQVILGFETKLQAHTSLSLTPGK